MLRICANENGKLAPLFDAATIERYTKSFGRILPARNHQKYKDSLQEEDRLDKMDLQGSLVQFES